MPLFAVRQIVVVLAGGLELEDLRAKVTHLDPANMLHGVRFARNIREEQVRVPGLELYLTDPLEQFAGVDLLLRDAVVLNPVMVAVGDIALRERLALHLLHVVRGEQIHILVRLRELEGDVRHDHADGQRLDADRFVGVLLLRVEHLEDIGVVDADIDSAGTLTLTKLVRVPEGCLEDLHHGHEAAGGVRDALDGCARFAEVREVDSDTATPLR